MLTVEGGTGAIVEYHGPGADSISATGKATICNMGAEIGATTSLFPYDHNMAMYLKATGREAIADAADKVAERPAPRRRRAVRPARSRSTSTQLKPLINGPHSPDRAHRVGHRGRRRGDGERLAARDLLGADRLVHQLVVRGHHPGGVDRPPGGGEGPDGQDRAADHARLRADPGDDRARRPARRPRGRSAPRCSPTPAGRASASGRGPTSDHRAAEHDRQLVQPQLPEAQRRLGQHAVSFVTSPDTVMALALAGRLDFDPTHRHAHRARRHRGHARGAGRRGAARRAATTPARTRSRRRPPTAPASPSRSTRRATACSCSSRSRRGTATTTSACRC